MKSKEKHVDMNRQILIHTRMVIPKRILNFQIGIIQLTLKFRFDILATVKILMWVVNPQISEALIPFLFKFAKSPSSNQKLLNTYSYT